MALLISFAFISPCTTTPFHNMYGWEPGKELNQTMISFMNTYRHPGWHSNINNTNISLPFNYPFVLQCGVCASLKQRHPQRHSDIITTGTLKNNLGLSREINLNRGSSVYFHSNNNKCFVVAIASTDFPKADDVKGSIKCGIVGHETKLDFILKSSDVEITKDMGEQFLLPCCNFSSPTLNVVSVEEEKGNGYQTKVMPKNCNEIRQYMKTRPVVRGNCTRYSIQGEKILVKQYTFEKNVTDRETEATTPIPISTTIQPLTDIPPTPVPTIPEREFVLPITGTFRNGDFGGQHLNPLEAELEAVSGMVNKDRSDTIPEDYPEQQSDTEDESDFPESIPGREVSEFMTLTGSGSQSSEEPPIWIDFQSSGDGGDGEYLTLPPPTMLEPKEIGRNEIDLPEMEAGVCGDGKCHSLNKTDSPRHITPFSLIMLILLLN